VAFISKESTAGQFNRRVKIEIRAGNSSEEFKFLAFHKLSNFVRFVMRDSHLLFILTVPGP
jgi:hypothetical protein